jgi:hypothetical protein
VRGGALRSARRSASKRWIPQGSNPSFLARPGRRRCARQAHAERHAAALAGGARVDERLVAEVLHLPDDRLEGVGGSRLGQAEGLRTQAAGDGLPEALREGGLRDPLRVDRQALLPESDADAPGGVAREAGREEIHRGSPREAGHEGVAGRW